MACEPHRQARRGDRAPAGWKPARGAEPEDSQGRGHPWDGGPLTWVGTGRTGSGSSSGDNWQVRSQQEGQPEQRLEAGGFRDSSSPALARGPALGGRR